MHDEAKSLLRLFCKYLGASAECEVNHGNPDGMISSPVEERNVDLIIMGTRGLSYLQSMLIGSVTDTVLIIH